MWKKHNFSWTPCILNLNSSYLNFGCMFTLLIFLNCWCYYISFFSNWLLWNKQKVYVKKIDLDNLENERQNVEMESNAIIYSLFFNFFSHDFLSFLIYSDWKAAHSKSWEFMKAKSYINFLSITWFLIVFFNACFFLVR